MHYPYVSIENGQIKVDFDRKGSLLCFPANEKGAINTGKAIRERWDSTVLFSSSVDHPTEYGAPDLDFRRLITTVYFDVSPLTILDTIYQALQYYIDQGKLEGVKVSQDNDNKDGTIIFDTDGNSWVLSSNDIRECDSPDFE